MMETEQNNTANRGPDGRFVASTPPPAEPAESTTGISSTQVPAQDGVADPYQVAFDRLVKEQRTTADEPSPAASDTPASGDNSSPDASLPSGGENPAPPVLKIGEYEDLDAGTFNVLKAEKKLPPPSLWQNMDAEERALYIEGVKTVRNQKNRNYNTKQHAAAGQGAVRDEPPEPGVQGSHGQDKPDGQSGKVQLPEDVESELQVIADELGEDSPLYLAQRRLAERHQRELSELKQFRDNQKQEHERSEQDRALRGVEDAEFDKLQQQFPQLAKSESRENARREMRDAALRWQQMGRTFTAAEAAKWGASFSFSQENQERSQQQRADARRKSLDGTFDRGSASPSDKTPTLSPEEREKRGFKLLAEKHREGITGRDAIKAVRAALKQ